MDKMTPPPNYYGAPYPNQQNQNNQMYPKNPQFNNVFTPEMVPVANMEQENQNGTGAAINTYNNLLDGIENVDSLFNIMKDKLSNNIGRYVKVYASFTDSSKWHDVIFEGTLMAIADDFMIVKRNDNKQYDLISRVYINYISFFEKE